MKVIIIGGVAGGASTAARLRRLDENAQIIMFEKGEYISFANCGLPYFVGDVIADRAKLLVMPQATMTARFKIDIRTRSEVTAIDRAAKTVTVRDHAKGEDYTESYDKLVIATGSSPIVPGFVDITSPRVFNVWNMNDADNIKTLLGLSRPRHATVIGGGFVGIEMMENLADMGIPTTLIELQDQVMTNVDFDMAQLLHKHIRQKGVDLRLGAGLAGYTEDENGLHLSLTDGSALDSDLMILAVGVRPNSGLAKAAGLTLNARGGVVTDEHMLTSDPDIYAVGDVVETEHFVTGERTMIPLAGPANKQGRVCADNLAGIPSVYQGSKGASVAKVFDLTAASVGLNIKQLAAMGMQPGRDYCIAKAHGASNATYYPDSYQLNLKVLYTREGKILGAMAVGQKMAEKRIDVIATAMHYGAHITSLKDLELCYAPPYSSAKDPVNMIGFMAENNLTGFSPVISHEEYAAMSEDEKAAVILLDVREPRETQRGTMPGAVCIPLGQLRDRLAELDKARRIIVYCAVGVRAHTATRILRGNGFDAWNLSGGYTTYSQMMD